MNKLDRIKGACYGLVIGDALGVPYEFHSKKEIGKIENLKYGLKDNILNVRDVPYGTWSDDSSQMLSLMSSLIDNPQFSIDDFGKKLINWLYKGYLAVNNKVFDCGIQTEKALRAYKKGTKAEICGLINPNGKGNGSLMRVLPVGLLEDKNKVLEIAKNQSLITHGNVTNLICCQIYSLIINKIIREENRIDVKELYDISKEEVIRYWNKSSISIVKEMEEIDSFTDIKGTGYVVDTLVSSIKIMSEVGSYEEAVIKAIEMGNDTDTTASVVGGLAGAKFGYKSISINLRDELKEKKTVDNIYRKFIEKVEIIV